MADLSLSSILQEYVNAQNGVAKIMHSAGKGNDIYAGQFAGQEEAFRNMQKKIAKEVEDCRTVLRDISRRDIATQFERALKGFDWFANNYH